MNISPHCVKHRPDFRHLTRNPFETPGDFGRMKPQVQEEINKAPSHSGAFRTGFPTTLQSCTCNQSFQSWDRHQSLPQQHGLPLTSRASQKRDRGKSEVVMKTKTKRMTEMKGSQSLLHSSRFNAARASDRALYCLQKLQGKEKEDL